MNSKWTFCRNWILRLSSQCDAPTGDPGVVGEVGSVPSQFSNRVLWIVFDMKRSYRACYCQCSWFLQLESRGRPSTTCTVFKLMMSRTLRLLLRSSGLCGSFKTWLSRLILSSKDVNVSHFDTNRLIFTLLACSSCETCCPPPSVSSCPPPLGGGVVICMQSSLVAQRTNEP